MTDQVATGAIVAPASSNVFARLAGVIFSPRDTFAAIVAQPKWLGAMAVVTLTIAVAQYAFLSTTVGQDAMVDQQIHQTERWAGSVTQAQIDGIEQRAPMNKYIVAAATLIIGPIVTFLITGILFGVFNAMLGGDATFKQALAVTTHGGAINILQTLFVVPLNYFRESMTSATNLGVFVQSFLEDTNFVARLLGWFDMFIIWGLLVTAIGLGVLYKRKTAPIFWTFMGIYVVIALVGAALMKG
jgi:Yip1 domain